MEYVNSYMILKNSLISNEEEIEEFYTHFEKNSTLLTIVCLEYKIKKSKLFYLHIYI